MPRITTLAINPTVDVSWEVHDMVPIRKLRSSRGKFYAGGGGINVSRVIATLGGESTAVLTRGGITGTVLSELLDDLDLNRRVVKIKGRTRLAVTVFERSTTHEFRVTPPGPEMSEDEWQAFLNRVSKVDGEYVVCTGSLPEGVPTDFYARVAVMVKERGGKVILDTSGRALFDALNEGVYVVKPNQRELENLVGRNASTPAEQEEIAQQLVAQGKAEIVALTLGAEGALLVWKDGVKRLSSPRVDVKSAVGAGDSFVGGLTYGLAYGRSLEDSFTLAVAAGTAAVMTAGTELCRKEDVDRLYAELRG